MYDLLTAGELNADLILTGLKQAPVLGLEILADGYKECMGSSTAICACAASSLGLRTAFFGKVGGDAYGDLAMKTLRRWGVDTGAVIRSPQMRTGVTVSMSTPHDRALVTWYGDTIDSFDAEEIPLGTLPARHLHVGSYFLQRRLHAGLPEAFRRAREMGMTTSLDAGWNERGDWTESLGSVLPQTDYFFPNEKEAACIAGTDDMDEAARRIAAMGCTAVIKLGAEGSLCCGKDGRILRCEGFRVRAVDTTGAGDSFNAGFLRAVLRGEPPERCLLWGNAAGAVCVQHEGGASRCPAPEEAEALIRQREGT